MWLRPPPPARPQRPPQLPHPPHLPGHAGPRSPPAHGPAPPGRACARAPRASVRGQALGWAGAMLGRAVLRGRDHGAAGPGPGSAPASPLGVGPTQPRASGSHSGASRLVLVLPASCSTLSSGSGWGMDGENQQAGRLRWGFLVMPVPASPPLRDPGSLGCRLGRVITCFSHKWRQRVSGHSRPGLVVLGVGDHSGGRQPRNTRQTQNGCFAACCDK